MSFTVLLLDMLIVLVAQSGHTECDQLGKGRLKRTYVITRLTANFMCDLMSDLVNCKFRKGMVIHDTECPY